MAQCFLFLFSATFIFLLAFFKKTLFCKPFNETNSCYITPWHIFLQPFWLQDRCFLP